MENKQQRIRYDSIIKLGFKVEKVEDKAYFNCYGFGYEIIELNLTKRIYADFQKETGFVNIHRIDKDYKLVGSMPIINYNHLLQMINFFKK
jgi:hypothetical protein